MVRHTNEKSLPFLLTAKDSGPTIFPLNNRVAF